MSSDAAGVGRGGKLSPQMLSVLHTIAYPHPDDEPFPLAGTIKALARRGLIKFVTIRKPQNVFEILHGSQFQRLRVSAAGLSALSDAGRAALSEAERP